jgi:hypothetical protein
VNRGSSNQEGNLPIDRVACCSRYHFHRVYHALLAETVNDTVRRWLRPIATRTIWTLALPVCRKRTPQRPTSVDRDGAGGIRLSVGGALWTFTWLTELTNCSGTFTRYPPRAMRMATRWARSEP